MTYFVPNGYVAISEVNPLIICTKNQEHICKRFANVYPHLWKEVLMEAHIKAQENRFCSIAFLAQTHLSSTPLEIHCCDYEFPVYAKFEFHTNTQNTFTDDHHTLQNIFVIVKA